MDEVAGEEITWRVKMIQDAEPGRRMKGGAPRDSAGGRVRLQSPIGEIRCTKQRSTGTKGARKHGYLFLRSQSQHYM